MTDDIIQLGEQFFVTKTRFWCLSLLDISLSSVANKPCIRFTCKCLKSNQEP